jgi:hypothetical protein
MSKIVDLLDEDKPIAEQKYACLSFISPEKIIKQKDVFFFEQFIKTYDFNKSIEKYIQFLNFVSYKYNVDSEKLHEDFKEYVESEKESLKTSVEDDYKNFVENSEEKLEKEFSKLHEFQTSVRGIKVRGVFPSQEEAELRCKMLREVDPNHDVYVGPVGLWVPFHPEAYKTGNVQYLESELNSLMNEKNKNEEKAKLAFDTRVKESKLNAIKENMEKAEKHGNKLTQTITASGELISISNMNTQEKTLGVNASLEDIEKELFEGDNIVMEKNSDHGVNDLLKKNKDKDE